MNQPFANGRADAASRWGGSDPLADWFCTGHDSFMATDVPTSMARALAFALVLSATPASAALPPPIETPPELDEPVDGYDMRAPYQLWRYWVESRKGPVTEDLLSHADAIEGLTSLGLLLRFTKHNDFGHYLTGEIRSHCRTDPETLFVPVPGSCVYLLRRAYVPLDAATYGEPNPLSEWTSANFDAAALARHFREIGLTPDTGG